VEPLFQATKKNDEIHGAYVEAQGGRIKFDVQGYADNMIFISESEDGISQMLQILDQYTQWSKLEFNISKCATASCIYDEKRRWTYLDQCHMFRGEEIPNLTTAESMIYLGAPIAARKTVKLKSVKFKLEEMDILLGKIMSSPLLMVQKIDAMKTFLL
jgi:hypothetical protein